MESILWDVEANWFELFLSGPDGMNLGILALSTSQRKSPYEECVMALKMFCDEKW